MFEPGCFIRGSVGARCGKRCEVEFEFERVFKFELEWPRLFSNIFFTFFSIFFDRFSLFFDVETQQKKTGTDVWNHLTVTKHYRVLVKCTVKCKYCSSFEQLGEENPLRMKNKRVR